MYLRGVSLHMLLVPQLRIAGWVRAVKPYAISQPVEV